MKEQHWQDSDYPLGLYLAFLTKRFLGYLSERLSPVGLDRYFRVLVVVEQSNESFSQQNLADYFQMNKAAMVRIIDYLSAKGFLERQVNEQDRRQHFIRLTDKARKALPEIKQCIKEIHEIAFKGLNQEQKEQFFQSLKLMYGNMAGFPEEDLFLHFKQAKNIKKKKTQNAASAG